MHKVDQFWAFLLGGLAFLSFSCTSGQESISKEKAPEQPLKEVMKDHFRVGAAIHPDHFNGTDSNASQLVRKHFNSISPKNFLKMGPLQRVPGVFNFGPADNYVDYGEENGMFIVGHTLVWHNQVPNWLFVDDKGNEIEKDSLLLRMENHIIKVVGRYKGRIDGWDVVNEVLNEEGSLRQSKWQEITGVDFIEKAFISANQADPEAELYYNDYNLWKPKKRDGAVKLVQNLQKKGIKVDGIGMQAHWALNYPSLDDIEASILAFAALGVQVMITELDIDVLPSPGKKQGADVNLQFDEADKLNPYPESLPDSVQEKLSQRYAQIFELFSKHRDKITRVTFWGVTDKDSWLNNWPVKGRKSYPLLFDTNYQPKPAFSAAINAVRD